MSEDAGRPWRLRFAWARAGHAALAATLCSAVSACASVSTSTRTIEVVEAERIETRELGSPTEQWILGTDSGVVLVTGRRTQDCEDRVVQRIGRSLETTRTLDGMNEQYIAAGISVLGFAGGGAALALSGSQPANDTVTAEGESTLSSRDRFRVVGGLGVAAGVGALIMLAVNASQAADDVEELPDEERVASRSTRQCLNEPITAQRVDLVAEGVVADLGVTDGDGVLLVDAATSLPRETFLAAGLPSSAAVMVAGRSVGAIDLRPYAEAVGADAWAVVERDDVVALEGFIALYPGSSSAAEATRILNGLRAAETAAADLAQFEALDRANDDALFTYLDQHPTGDFATQVRVLLVENALDRGDAAEAEARTGRFSFADGAFRAESSRLTAAVAGLRDRERRAAAALVDQAAGVATACHGTTCSAENAERARRAYGLLDQADARGIPVDDADLGVLSRCRCTRSEVER